MPVKRKVVRKNYISRMIEEEKEQAAKSKQKKHDRFKRKREQRDAEEEAQGNAMDIPSFDASVEDEPMHKAPKLRKRKQQEASDLVELDETLRDSFAQQDERMQDEELQPKRKKRRIAKHDKKDAKVVSKKMDME